MAFEKVIGYDALKQELLEIIDIMQNKEVYEALNASCPSGLLLYGRPGVGKTLISNGFIEASGRPAVVCRKNASEQNFIDSINQAFNEALELAPSIILLDDMDKFANDDEKHQDSEAYVTIQSCIDAVKGEDVFVLATANNIRKLPDSLIRTGRFGLRIEVDSPNEEDSRKIIEHYLAGKGLHEDVDIEALAQFFGGCACSTLETVINQAGIIAGYKRANHVSMEDLVQSYIQIVHHVPKGELRATSNINLYAANGSSQVIWHEAAHAVMSELLAPGSVTLVVATIGTEGERGFTNSHLKSLDTDMVEKIKTDVMVSLASAAAIDLMFGRVDLGAESDMESALRRIRDLNEDNGAFSGFGMMSPSYEVPSTLAERRQVATTTVAGLYYWETKELLSRNRAFLEAMARALAEESILTAIDIAAIRQSVGL